MIFYFFWTNENQGPNYGYIVENVKKVDQNCIKENKTHKTKFSKTSFAQDKYYLVFEFRLERGGVKTFFSTRKSLELRKVQIYKYWNLAGDSFSDKNNWGSALTRNIESRKLNIQS